MEICLIDILSHLMPEEVFSSPKVSREIRVEKGYTITCSASYISHLGRWRPRGRQAWTLCTWGQWQRWGVRSQAQVSPACLQVSLKDVFCFFPAVQHCASQALRHQQVHVLWASGDTGKYLPESTVAICIRGLKLAQKNWLSGWSHFWMSF